MTQTPVNLSPSGPPETILAELSPDDIDALVTAQSAPSAERKQLLSQLAAARPKMLEAWVLLGETTEELAEEDNDVVDAATVMEAYAYFRVGYHRGLDALRAAGWRGSGYVRSVHVPNRAFLACVTGLARCAATIGEADEHERCLQFLAQLDPDGVGKA